MREVFLCYNTGKVCYVIVITNWRHEHHINESDNIYHQLIYYLINFFKKDWNFHSYSNKTCNSLIIKIKTTILRILLTKLLRLQVSWFLCTNTLWLKKRLKNTVHNYMQFVPTNKEEKERIKIIRRKNQWHQIVIFLIEHKCNKL